MERTKYVVGVPDYGEYEVIFNSNSKAYGGDGKGSRRVKAKTRPADGHPYSIEVTLPPLTAYYLRLTPLPVPARKKTVKAASAVQTARPEAPKTKKSAPSSGKKRTQAAPVKAELKTPEAGAGKLERTEQKPAVKASERSGAVPAQKAGAETSAAAPAAPAAKARRTVKKAGQTKRA